MNINFDIIQIKNDIPFSILEIYARVITESSFVTLEDKSELYMPGRAEAAVVSLFYSHLVEGFDPGKDFNYDTCIEDTSLYEFFKAHRTEGPLPIIEHFAALMTDFEKQRRIRSSSHERDMLNSFLEKESLRIDAEIEANREMKRLAKAQALQTENANRVNQYFSSEEQAELLKKMDEYHFAPDKIGDYLLGRLNNNGYPGTTPTASERQSEGAAEDTVSQ